ncbi:MAG: choice-of-anchor D domain-containing protein [Polyangiaceae bacterium]|nr:choice-of-anchor D domain-containing protein [Polyangiaceae bacterium]MCW5789057.1 choice-of-anchor D domain-containing protein [Polyangiaceae bacterium]
MKHLAFPLALGAALFASPAWADDAGAPGPALDPGDVLAIYCDDVELSCTNAPLFFSKTVELPIAFDWDTNWIPSGSPLQVRFFVRVPAMTQVDLAGILQTDWPPALRHLTPGVRNGGYLMFDYGLEVGAQARVDTKVLGISIKWTGDIPFFPQIDFHLKREKTFNSWAFDGSPPASAFTDKFRLFSVNLLGLAGIPSQISKGGVALDVYGELSAVYTTHRIRVEPAVRDITDKGDSTTSEFAGGAYAKFDVWPEGSVSYTGAIHLVPTFFIEVLGFDFDIPFIDYPIDFPLGAQEFVFDPVRVHVPLPDIPTPSSLEVDFGEVVVGDRSAGEVSLDNIGEAKARVIGFLGPGHAEHFTLLTTSSLIDPDQSSAVNLRFNPKAAGSFNGELTLVTNDPDNRFIKFTLKGTGVGQERPNYPDGSGGSSGNPWNPGGSASGATETDSGCACGVVGGQQRGAGSFGFLSVAGLGLGVGLVLARRRRTL